MNLTGQKSESQVLVFGETFPVNKQIVQILIQKNRFHKDKFLNYLFEFFFY